MDYQQAIRHAQDPLALVAILRRMEPGWVADALDVATSMDAQAFEEWQVGLMKEHCDIWSSPAWYGKYGVLLNPPAYRRAVETELGDIPDSADLSAE